MQVSNQGMMYPMIYQNPMGFNSDATADAYVTKEEELKKYDF